ncbi:MAG TPA: DUF1361 domain-containing protein [Gaiellaceae bacterium]|nr:DUF1361 domain-containing protein [Gaiellaceae bacterium]
MSPLRSVTTRRLIALGTLVGLSTLVVVMVAVRISATGSLDYLNLVWNLVLAWIPLGLALIVYDGARRGVAGHWLLSLGALWLLFFPNAPYLMTDLKYLRDVGGAPFWFDAVLAGSAAVTGLALGFLSLYLVHAVVQRRFGAVWAWVGVWAILLVGSVGVFLGRYQRFNSWDVFTDPAPIFGDLAKGLSDPLNYPKVLAVTTVFSGFLVGGYAIFYALARVSRLLDDEPQSI